jgi:hypothetical protein
MRNDSRRSARWTCRQSSMSTRPPRTKRLRVGWGSSLVGSRAQDIRPKCSRTWQAAPFAANRCPRSDVLNLPVPTYSFDRHRPVRLDRLPARGATVTAPPPSDLDDDRVLPFLTWVRDYSGLSESTCRRICHPGGAVQCQSSYEQQLEHRTASPNRSWSFVLTTPRSVMPCNSVEFRQSITRRVLGRDPQTVTGAVPLSPFLMRRATTVETFFARGLHG